MNIKESFSKIEVSKDIENKILNKTIYKVPKFKLSYIFCSIILISIIGLSLIYTSYAIEKGKSYNTWEINHTFANNYKILVGNNLNFKKISKKIIENCENRHCTSYKNFNKNELENILNTHILYSNKLNQNTFNIDISLNENGNIGKLVLSNNSIYNSIPINIRLTVLGNNSDEVYILTMQEGPSSNSDSKYIETYKINKLNINAIIYSYNEKMETNFLAIEFVYKDIFYEFIGSNITKEELINFINTLQ